MQTRFPRFAFAWRVPTISRMTTVLDLPPAEAAVLHAPRAAPVQPLDIQPLHPAGGAFVRGLRWRAQTPPATAQALRGALLQYGFLSFEPGSVTADNFTELLDLFGTVTVYSGPKTPLAGANAKANVVDSRDKRFARNMLWHMDQAFRPEPPKLTALFGQEVPTFGGDTLFSNAVHAFESLDPLLVKYLETLTAVHNWDATGHVADRFAGRPEEAARARAEVPPLETPLFRTHPETGRRQIFVNESYTAYIKDVPRAVSNALLAILFDAIKAPEHLARYSWRQGALLVWDNASSTTAALRTSETARACSTAPAWPEAWP